MDRLFTPAQPVAGRSQAVRALIVAVVSSVGGAAGVLWAVTATEGDPAGRVGYGVPSGLFLLVGLFLLAGVWHNRERFLAALRGR